MDYAAAQGYLEGLIDFEKVGAAYFAADRFQLDSVRRLLAGVRDPQNQLEIAHISGTKGKGSTAAMLDAILRSHGLTVGLFTQPHLRDIRERTRVNGATITGQDFARHTARLRPVVERLNGEYPDQSITFYEAHLALTLLHFAEAGVRFGVMETGLGGRLDATNALTPLVSAITRIDYDHTELLGGTLEAIAQEKAGILKPGVPCVFAAQEPHVERILQDRARAVGAPVIPTPRVEGGTGLSDFSVDAGKRYDGLEIPLRGAHQRENAALAIALAEALERTSHGWRLTVEGVRCGLCGVVLPGRFQVLPGAPTVVLDVAHNPVSARVLRDGLRELMQSRGEAARLHIVAGLARDKDISGFARTLFPIADGVLCTQSASGRAAPAAVVLSAARDITGNARAIASVAEAVAQARALADTDDVICITGSFHVVGEAMEVLGVDTD